MTPSVDDRGLFLFSNAAGAGQLQMVARSGQEVTVGGEQVRLDGFLGAIGSREDIVFQSAGVIFDGEPRTIPSPRLYRGMPMPEIAENAEIVLLGTRPPNIQGGWNGRSNYLGQIPMVVSYGYGGNATGSAVIVSSKTGIRVVTLIGGSIRRVFPASLSINDTGRTAFLADIVDEESGAVVRAILKEEGGNDLREVVRDGDKARGSAEESLPGLVIRGISTNVALNTTGEVLFEAGLFNSTTGTWEGSALLTETQSTNPSFRMVARENGQLEDLPDEDWVVSNNRFFAQALETGALVANLTVRDPGFQDHRTLWSERRLDLFQPFPVGCTLQGDALAYPFPADQIGGANGWNTFRMLTGGQDGQQRMSTPDGKKMVAIIEGQDRFNEQALVVIHNGTPPREAEIQLGTPVVQGGTMAFSFRFRPGATGFRVLGSFDLSSGFPIDKTADAAIEESEPGHYHLRLSLVNAGRQFFVKVAAPPE